MVDYPPPHKTFSAGPALPTTDPDHGTCMVCGNETWEVAFEASDDADFCLTCQRKVVEAFRQRWKTLSRWEQVQLAVAIGLPAYASHDR